MVEGEDLAQYVRPFGLTVQKLAMLGGAKVDDDVNVHIVQTLTAYYKVEMNVLLSSPGLTRSNIEEVVRIAYMSHKQNVGNRRSKMAHMLSTPAVLIQPVQGETGCEGTQKRNRKTDKSIRNSSSRNNSGSSGSSCRSSSRSSSSSSSTTVVVAVSWAHRIV